MRQLVAGAFYVAIAVVSLGLGATYVFRDSFMPYHEQALQRSWTDLDASLQVLILALMDVAGAGWIVLGVLTLALVFGPFSARRLWARLIVPGAALVFYLPTLMATLTVTSLTPATAPWYGNALAILAAIVGFAIDAPWTSNDEESGQS